MRRDVLWADDQVDVARTFAGLLNRDEFRIKFVPDGENALAQLKDRWFDLVILDLAMPPGRWGGLWLLKRLSEEGIRVNVIVLSAEGGQDETIGALRLGASDYVIKTAVERELPERVRAVLDERTRKLRAGASDELALPIALPFRRFLSATTDHESIQLGNLAYESAIRYVALAGLAIAEAEGWLRTLSLQIKGLAKPTLGTWSHVLNRLCHESPSASAFAELVPVVDRAESERVVAIRNDLAHGGLPSAQKAGELRTQVEGAVFALVNRFSQRVNSTVAVVSQMSYSGAAFSCEIRVLSGDAAVPITRVIESVAPLRTGDVVLVTKTEETFSLSPWMIATPGTMPNALRLLAFDGWRDGPQELVTSSTRPVRFVDVVTGERNPSDTPVVDLTAVRRVFAQDS